MNSFLEFLTEMARVNPNAVVHQIKEPLPKEWENAESRIKKSIGKLGHVQCNKKGGCGHQVDAMISGVGISIGHGDNFAAKDVGQGTLKLQDDGSGRRKWAHTASSAALQRHASRSQFTDATVGGLKGKKKKISKEPVPLVDILHAHYGTKLKAPKKPIKSGKQMKHMNDEAYHIHKGGEMYLPIDGRILGDHHKEHHGSLYHIQHINVKSKGGKVTRQAHLYRTTKDNPLNILDKQGNPPPILGSGLKVALRVRAKDSTRQKETGLYNRRAVTAVKVFGKVKDTPSSIDLLRPHETMHSSSEIFVRESDVKKAKRHD